MRAQQTSYQLFTLTPQEKLVMTAQPQLVAIMTSSKEYI